MSARTSGSDAKTNGSADSRQHHDGSSGRAYTVEQKAAVIRIRKCGATAFYDILGLESERTTVSDAGIKKAYRKQSLLTHPDKNGYQGADEAFKMVSRAFQILSDADKKRRYDQFGGDPDSRFSSASASSSAAGGGSPFPGFGRAPPGFASNGFGGGFGQGSAFEEEMSADEVFRRFFGAGGPFGGGGGFGGGGPAFVFNMGGGPGIRVHQFGGGRPRGRGPQAQEGPQSALAALSNLLPLLLLFLIPILSSLFSAFSSGLESLSTPNVPLFKFDTAEPPLTEMRTSAKLRVQYFVNPADVDGYSGKQWKVLDGVAENKLMYELDFQCAKERQLQERLLRESQGWFIIDPEKFEAAQSMELKACNRYRSYFARR